MAVTEKVLFKDVMPYEAHARIVKRDVASHRL